MLGSRPNRKPTFLWQGILIILPVAVMSAVGLLAIRRDRVVVEEEARGNASQLADQFAFALARALPAKLAAHDFFSEIWSKHQWDSATGSHLLPESDTYSSQLAAWQANNPGLEPQDVLPNRLGVRRDGKLAWPADSNEPPETPPWFIGKSEPQRQAWEALCKAAPYGSSVTNVESNLEEFLKTDPAPEARVNAEFITARTRIAQKSALDAMKDLQRFSQNWRGFRTESGVPLLSLAAAEAFRVLSRSSDAERILNLDFSDQESYRGDLVNWVLREPSLLAPDLLVKLRSLIVSNSIDAAKHRPRLQAADNIWFTQQRLHAIVEFVRRHGFLSGSDATNFWIHAPVGSWFCRVAPIQIPESERDSIAQRMGRATDIIWLADLFKGGDRFGSNQRLEGIRI